MQLSARIEENAWDGDWYRRAYFDDGTPLGSKSNTECQIDSISQSWAVLSGAGDAERSRRAMDAVYARLVRLEHGLIQLLDPPFDNQTSSRLYPRLRARRARKRRAIHARGRLDRDGVRCLGDSRAHGN